MDEVWFPAGVIRWAPTETTPDILDGLRDTMNYYSTRTPIELTEVSSVNQGGLSKPDQLGVLEVRYSEGTFNYGYGGQTKHYRKPNQGRKIVKISFENVKTRTSARSTLAHEMGHVLGFTHEFQRWDRDENGVTLKFGFGRDPYNGGRPDKKNVRVLTPYDFHSQFAVGYAAHVDPDPKSPANGLLSKHDINSIYRVYGRALGSMQADVHYGEAAASGDFDGDGIEDIAIAAQYIEPGSDKGAIYFYKGVAQAPGESGTGTTYVSWFREEIPFAAGQGRSIVLATGDTHSIPVPGATSTVADGIDELVVGLPDADRVEVWVVNGAGRFGFHDLPAVSDGLGTYGGHGIGAKIVIHAADVGATTALGKAGFGSALATGRFFSQGADDLAIGAPTITAISIGGALTIGSSTAAPDAKPVSGPSVFLLPGADATRAVRIMAPTGDADSEFGAALAVMPSFDHATDTIVVGAPGRREVFVYRRAYVDHAGKVIAPDLLDSFTGSTADSRFGEALATFTTREEGSSSTEHWIAIGAPRANVSGAEVGSVELYKFAFSGSREFTHRLSAPDRQDGMRFGKAIAVNRDDCTATLCPKNRIRLAIGSPRATADGHDSGKVYLWDVWSGGELNRSTAERWSGANDDARYGQNIVSVRETDPGGGFVILAKKGDFSLGPLSGAAIRTGFAEIRLNSGSRTNWSSWVRTLVPGTAGDTPPKNR